MPSEEHSGSSLAPVEVAGGGCYRRPDLSRDEIVAALLQDIHDTGKAASVRRVARKRRLASEFAAEREWQLASKPFGLGALMRASAHCWVKNTVTGETYHSQPRFFDHPYYFRKNRRAIAIVSHLYGLNADALDAFTKSNGLSWETPSFPSWWYPGQTTLIVFTRAVPGTTGTTGDHSPIE
jgi:hypothetical protein